MKVKIALVAALILTNLFWGYQVYLNRQAAQEATTTVYRLSGSHGSWSVVDYLIILTPNSISRGHGKLVYTGDKSALKDATDFFIEVREEARDGKKQGVLGFASNFIDEALIDTGLKEDFGSVSHELNRLEALKDIRHFESSEVSIRWKDQMGNRHEETLSLDIDQTIQLGDYEARMD